MKTEVYSWRVSTDLKTGLEREARRRKISLAKALDLAAEEWLKKSGADDDDASKSVFTKLPLSFWASSRVAIPIGPRTCAKSSESACGGVMAADALIDTGAILAMLDERDPWHRICVETFQQPSRPSINLRSSADRTVSPGWRRSPRNGGRMGICPLRSSETGGDPGLRASGDPRIDVALLGPPDGFRRRYLWCTSRSENPSRPSLPWTTRISKPIASKDGVDFGCCLSSGRRSQERMTRPARRL